MTDEPVPPNRRERDIAYGLERYADRNGIAYALAAAREGGTLEGPRSLVSGHARLSLRAVRASNSDAVSKGIEFAWRSWFGEISRRNLRPVGWPSVQRTYLATGSLTMHEPLDVEVDEGDGRAEWLVVSVTCEAVPA